ncbi:DUF1304 family protein [Demequina sp. NBRC 110053]|uniref:DUF1304 family protein n=1 Tax=Demequina sp. NBRC 110053 TaxID=1570342 RepID=UPI00118526EA|nr:DUF1304 family protein [Demequina sp. NBRC 110053]
MQTVIIALSLVAGALHACFFVLESVLWDRRAVSRLFGARSSEEAHVLAPAMLNLGFYNLFLGLGAAGGAWRWAATGEATLLVYALAFMIAAALVLVARSRAMWRGALVQGLPPALALLALAAA